MALSNIIFVFSSALLATLVLAGPGFGGRHGGPGGRHGGPPPPPFLRNVSEEGRRAFFNIAMNQNLTLNQIESQTAQWAQTYGVADQYQQFEANMTAHRDEIQRNVTGVISNLSAAQNALEAVFNNKDQTRQQQREAIDQLKQQYPQEIPVLFFISGQSRRGPGGRGGRGGMMKKGPGYGGPDFYGQGFDGQGFRGQQGQYRFQGGRNQMSNNNNGFDSGNNSQDMDDFGRDF